MSQMYNLVKPSAHPAGFEPTACRLGGGRSILLSYGCKALILKASSDFDCLLLQAFSNIFLLVVRTGSNKFRRPFEQAFANSSDFLPASCHLTISVFHRLALDGLYLRRWPLYPGRSTVAGSHWSRLQAPFRANKLESLPPAADSTPC